MFENYQNINTQYVPNNYQNSYGYNSCNDSMQTSTPNKPYEIKDQRGNITGYFWYQGDSVNLSFDIVGEFTDDDNYIDVENVIVGCKVTLTIFDFRYNIVHQESKQAMKTVEFPIGNDISCKMPRGKYTISLVISNDTGYSETLFNTDTCTFEVR